MNCSFGGVGAWKKCDNPPRLQSRGRPRARRSPVAFGRVRPARMRPQCSKDGPQPAPWAQTAAKTRYRHPPP